MKFGRRITGAASLGAAMLLTGGLSSPPAQAGYVVTVDQAGSTVVASGSGTIDPTGLSFDSTFATDTFIIPRSGAIVLGPAPPATEIVDGYTGFVGPASFGPQSGHTSSPDGGSGDFVGILATESTPEGPPVIFVPQGYVSGNLLSDTSTYDNATFASLGITPGTYVWTWGTGAHADSFTLEIGAVPAPLIGHGLPVLLAVGGLLFGAKLLGRAKREQEA